METATFLIWVLITIFQSIIYTKLILLNKTIEDELNNYVDWKLKHNGENIIEHYIDKRYNQE